MKLIEIVWDYAVRMFKKVDGVHGVDDELRQISKDSNQAYPTAHVSKSNHMKCVHVSNDDWVLLATMVIELTVILILV